MTATAARPVRDPVAEAIARAPVGEPFPPEVAASLDEALEDIHAGRGVRHDDVPAWLEEQAGRRQSW